VIYPVSTEDVSQILSFAHTNSIELAVCGAGHNHRGNSIDNGLVIDLRKMTGVLVDPVSKRVTTQGATVVKNLFLCPLPQALFPR
jgi:FAD/FMN-containing dehydrogenase